MPWYKIEAEVYTETDLPEEEYKRADDELREAILILTGLHMVQNTTLTKLDKAEGHYA